MSLLLLFNPSYSGDAVSINIIASGVILASDSNKNYNLDLISEIAVSENDNLTTEESLSLEASESKAQSLREKDTLKTNQNKKLKTSNVKKLDA